MRTLIRRQAAQVGILVVSAIMIFTAVASAVQPNRTAVTDSKKVQPAAAGDRRYVVCNGSVAIGSSCYIRGVGALNAAGLVSKIALGTFDIRFDIGILQCAYTATIGLGGNTGASAPGEITVVGRAGTSNGLFIQTFDSTGSIADRSFHVVVTC